MIHLRITVAAQEPGVPYRVVHIGEVGRRDAGVFRRAYGRADVEAMKIGPDDEVVYEDGDAAFKDVVAGAHVPDLRHRMENAAWR
jgi:hypothetical protein